jgi:ABC-2 type transport system permease protein
MATDESLSLAPRRAADWRVVAAKELADHLLSIRLLVLLVLLGLSVAGAVYATSGEITDAAEEATGTPALFVRLFSVSGETFPSLLEMVGFLVPLLGLAFGFDSVSSERSQRTLPRLVAQPIRRDDVINGKFAAALAVMAVVLLALTLLVGGIGILRLGIVPTADEIARIAAWYVLTVVYGGLWLAFATLLSVLLRRAATAALVSIAAWLVLTLFSGFLVGLAADVVAPLPPEPTVEEAVNRARWEQWLGRISPERVYDEATVVLLNPEVRSAGLLLPEQVDRAVPTPLPLDQSLMAVWPQVVALVALTVVVFAIAYVSFMWQEIRA